MSFVVERLDETHQLGEFAVAGANSTSGFAGMRSALLLDA